MKIKALVFPGGTDGKESACNAGDLGVIPEFNPWIGKTPWRRAWQPTPVFLPRESHGQRSPAGYSPWGRKESDMTERSTHLSLTIATFHQQQEGARKVESGRKKVRSEVQQGKRTERLADAEALWAVLGASHQTQGDAWS